MKAWYFSTLDKRLRYRDNRLIVQGETHSIKGKPELCKNGLHGSINLIDALGYAPGPYLWYVDIDGDVDIGKDKICGTDRKYIKGIDASDILRKFAKKQALINIEKIKPHCSAKDYEKILHYLNSEAVEAAARSAARSAAGSAAKSAAMSAARSVEVAAWSAEAAAWSAEAAARSTEAAAWLAARSAAEAAARSAEAAANKMLEEMVRKEMGI